MSEVFGKKNHCTRDKIMQLIWIEFDVYFKKRFLDL